MKIWMEKICGIPAKIAARTLIPDSRYWLVKAGITVTGWQSQAQFLGGYSVDKNLNTATLRAKNELAERALAINPISCENDSLELLNFHEKSIGESVSSKEALIGRFDGQIRDASGLSFHRNFFQAATHAACELIERHLLCSIWYGNRTKLRPLNVDFQIPEGIEEQHFTIYGQKDLPFTLSIITKPHERILTIGSAVKRSQKLSLAHSRKEALMLLDDLLTQGKGIVNGFTEKSSQRLNSLRGSAYQERINFLSSKIATDQPTNPQSKKFSSVCGLAHTIGLSSPRFVVVRKMTAGILVRGFIKNALQLNDMRNGNDRKAIVADPFC